MSVTPRVRRAVILLGLSALVALSACSNEVEGPQPSIGSEDEAGVPTAPGFACGEQLESWITLSGADFSPLTVDTLDDDIGANLVLPTVTLLRTQTVEGDADDSDPFEVTLVASTDPETTQVRWVDDATLQFRIDPSLTLPHGIYDVTVENANGTSATAPAAFGVLPRPVVTATVDDLVCLAQGERQVRVEGDFFLVDGEERPTITIDGDDYTPTETGDCRTLGDAFGGRELCKTATITLPESALEPGSYQATVTNQAPAACASIPEDDGINLVVLAPPTIADILPEPICAEQLDYDAMTITGTNFVRIDGETLPTVRIADKTYTASALDDCTEVEGLANQQAETCTSLTFAIPADDLAAQLDESALSTNLGVVVENPAPAGCETTEPVELTIVPPPTVADIQADPICTSQYDNALTVTGVGFLDVGGALPQVRIGETIYDAEALSDCTAIEGPETATESCETLTLTVPTGDLATAQNYGVSVINPADAACESTEDVQLTVVPPPSVATVEPQPICTADGDTVMTATGQDFLVIDGADYPSVAIGMHTYLATAADGCTDVAVQDDGMNTTAQSCTSLTFTIPQGDVAPENYDVVVTNPDPAACSSVEARDLTVVPPPTVTAITEEIACLAEGDRGFVVTGTDILVIDGLQPVVQIGPNTYNGTADGCTDMTVTGATVQSCTEVAITVPQSDLSAGVHDVTVLNPAPAACVSSDPIELTIAAPPTVAGVAPNPVCSDQLDSSVVVTGTGFLLFGSEVPTVTINGTDYVPTPGSCTDVTSVVGTAVQTCTELAVNVPAGDLIDGANAVSVTNPAPIGCTSTDAIDLIDAPAPTLVSVASDTTCVETQTASLTLTGTGFLTIGSELPAVSVGGQAATTTAASDCTPVAGLTGVESCTTLSVDVASGLATGSQAITVTNPGAAACQTQEAVSVEVVPAPMITTAQPDLFCNDTGDTQMTITGDHFYTAAGTLPEVVVAGVTYTPSAANGCIAVTGSSESLERCTELVVTIPQGTLTAGAAEVSVQNPAPVACASATTQEVVVAGPPTLTALVPSVVCEGQFDGLVELTGDNFLFIDGAEPTLDVNGTEVAIDSSTGCTDASTGAYTIQSCTSITFTVPVGLRDADMDISVVNPAPANCGSSSMRLTVEPTPIVASVEPLRVCGQNESTILLTGQNFAQGMTVELGLVTANSVVVDASGTSATATFAAGTLPAGEYVVTVTNPTTCSSQAPTPVRVTDGATVFYVDPPLVYNEIQTKVTIYLTGLYGASVSEVSVIDTAGTEHALTDIAFDPDKPNRVQAAIGGVLAEGLTRDTFDVKVTDSDGCVGSASDLITVTTETTLALEDISPPFGWTGSPTSVVVTALDPVTAGQEQFEPVPRLYINPSNAAAGSIAAELRSVQYIDQTEVSGIVDSGLPVGTYDVIAVNPPTAADPDGSVGVLLGAFEITQEPPPLVDTVSPGSWATPGTVDVIVEGESFRTPEIALTCLDGSGLPLDTSTLPIAVNSSTETTIDFTVTTDSLPHQSVCVMRVTNADGTYADYSPLTIFNPAGKFVLFRPGTVLTTARRAASGTSGVPARNAQFIYTIGGDDGTTAGAYNSVEVAQIDRFGNPRTWLELPYLLPTGRTLAKAVRIRDFIYLIGGHDGTAATTEVLRANVLDPLHTPIIDNVDIELSEAGLAQGVYYYRVSAVLAGSDPANPDGETLASDTQAISVPTSDFEVTISWAPPSDNPAVASYKVYRSPQPNMAAGGEELIATLPGTQNSFVDDGAMTTTGEVPLPLGSLGTWHKVADLNTARYSLAATTAADPITSGVRYIYAQGGTDGTTVFNDYEYLTVTINGPRDQSVAAPVQVTDNPVLNPRYEHEAITGDPTNVSVLSGSYVYLLGGRIDGGTIVRDVDIAEVLPGGLLAPWDPQTKQMQRSRAGYAAAIANDNLVTAAGPEASSSNTADRGEICDGSGTCLPPDLNGWTSLSQVDLRSRYLPAYTAFNGFLYLMGGIDPTTTTVLDTTDYSVMGGNP